MKKRIDNEKTKYLSEMLEPLDFFNHSFDQRQTHINNLLCRYLNTKTVIAFIGAGTSQALWYPGWGQFAKDIICILNILFDSKSPFKTFTEVGLNDALHKEERKFLENIFANEIKQKIIGQIFNIVFRSAKITYKQKNTEIEDEQKRAEYENKQKINLYNEIKLKFQKERPNFAKILAELLKPFVDGKQIEDAISAFLKNNNDERNKKTDIISIKWELYKRVLLDLSNESKQDTTLYEEAKRTYEKKATNPNIKSDDKNFEKYLKLLDHSSENELDALFIFSQCERLLCKKDDWEKNKQSSIFRKIVKTYFKCLQDQTTREEKKLKIINEKNNPYLALQKLPIKKFVTFNYDLEIERALLYGNKISYQLNKEIYNSEIKHEKITEAFGKKSFSQKKQEVDKLAEFLVTRYKETEYSIFHCHGRIDDVSSCIVSEEDYQKWYLKDEPEKYTPFRQTLDITLDSNPVLFMGFGLKDADLMRLLRQITANRPLNKIRTPLFCLLYVGDNDIESEAQIPDNCKWKTFDELHEECDALYMKYGLHVIPVFVNKMRENFGSGDTMCLKLLELFEDWEKWQKGIRQKPKFRKSPAQKSKGDKEKGNEENEYFHYKFEQQNTFIDKFDERFILQLVETVVDKKKDIQKEINNQKNKGANKEKDNQAKESNPTDVIISFPQHLAVVIGDGGTGKSWGVQKFLSGLFKEDMFLALLKLIENRIKDKEIKPRITKFFRQNHKKWKIFFWSAYYSNDVMTGIDRLIDFFIPINDRRYKNTDIRKDKFTLLKEIIDYPSKKNESIFDDGQISKDDRVPDEKRIIVFDGIEKLLIPNAENTEGISVSPEVKEFFKIISHQNNKNTRIILTSRIFPTDILYHFDSRINREERGEQIKKLEDAKLAVRETNVISAPKCWVKDLIITAEDSNSSAVEVKQAETMKDLIINPKNPKNFQESFTQLFIDIDEHYISSICSLVDGHIFGISLIKGVLEDVRGAEKVNKVNELIEKISNTPIDKRIQSVIENAIKNLEESYKDRKFDGKYFAEYFKAAKFIEKFVESIALFMHPVRKEIAQVCMEENLIDEVRQNKSTIVENIVEEIIKDLINKSIVQKVVINLTDGKTSATNGDTTAYVVHPLVRAYIFERLHKCVFVSLPSLQLPGFSSGKEIVDPGNDRGRKTAENLFLKLCEQAGKKSEEAGRLAKVERAAEETQEGAEKVNAKPEEKESEKNAKIACDMCRAAFSILRSRFCSNTVIRWGSYDEYLKLIVKLYDTSKRVSPADFWTYHEPTDDGLSKSEGKNYAPLHPDELAWVYNEVGLVSQSMGNNLNAIELWEQGFEINKIIDRYEKAGRYLFQSNINLGAINIYYGKLGVAQIHLDKAFEIANRLENKNLSNRVLGYKALLKYLQGNLEEAENDFNVACAGLEANPRARAFFYALQGEVLLKKKEIPKAEEFIERSRHLAEARYYPDLVAYSRLSRANILLYKEKYADAQYEFQTVLEVANKKGLFRLEAATLSSLSRLAEKIGDYQSASLRAIESLKISNEYCLGLHQTVGLLVLGRALVNLKLRDWGISFLKTARDLAKSQGYFLRLNEAEKELRKYTFQDLDSEFHESK